MDGRCKHPIEEIQAAVDGSISHEQAAKLREILKHIDEVKTHKQNIEAEILRLAAPYQETLDFIRTVPGFSSDPMTAIALLSEIGGDMSSRTIFPLYLQHKSLSVFFDRLRTVCFPVPFFKAVRNL
ncbi:MAG: hypothetical protein LBQ48_00590 [Oscillospiraceae bacterium]|nr:hypothetical protein [Oscillospiraceae bacterium]